MRRPAKRLLFVLTVRVAKLLLGLGRSKFGVRLRTWLRPLFLFLIVRLDQLIFRSASSSREIKNVLVYCPNLGGHRQIHSKKFIDFFRSKELEVYFVFSGLLDTDRPSGDTSYSIPYLEPLKNDAHVNMIDVSESFSENSDELRFIVSLQRKYSIDLTYIVDGDAFIWQLARQILPWKPKLLGKNYAVFIMSEFIYNQGPRRTSRRLFHLYLFKYFSLMSGGFYSDENIVNIVNSDRYIHLPDVWNTEMPAIDDCQKRKFYARVERDYAAFLRQHRDKDVVLAFGDLESRKGLEFLLRLVSEREDLVLVRVGRTKPGTSPTWSSVLHKEKLIMENRIYELDTYIEDQRVLDLLYQSTKFVPLPYRHFFRTSGAMVQAISYGKPVLVPNVGLLKERVVRNRIGRTFLHLSYDSFREEFLKLRDDYRLYADSARSYFEEKFGNERFTHILERMLD